MQDMRGISNYEYLKNGVYNSYIKPIYFEKSKTRKFKNDLNRVENLSFMILRKINFLGKMD